MFPHLSLRGETLWRTSPRPRGSVNAESEYWRGAEDLALLELNELTALHAPARIRQRSLEIFLAAAGLGAACMREKLAVVTKLASPERRDRRRGAACPASPSLARSSREAPP